MIHRLRWCIIAALVAASALLPAQRAISAPAADKQRIAVLDLAQQGTEQEAEAIAEELRKILVKSGRYIVIDRTLTDQILKEWETQQSGLTDGEKAVKIGKLFNVQLIVSGKLNKFASGGWQLSAVMLNAQTGVAIKAETVRHRGEFFSLLDGKVPALGAALVGTALPPGAPAQSVAARMGVKKRMAIYPALYSGQYARKMERRHERLLGTIQKVVRNNFAEQIEITHRMSSVGGVGGERNLRIMVRAWIQVAGALSKPDQAFVYDSAGALGVDLVLMYEMTVPEGKGEHRVYLYDVANRKEYRKTTRWKKGIVGNRLANAARIAISEYRRAR